MNTFTVELHDASRTERFEGVRAFVAADADGSFGIRARHAPFMTLLRFGLARFQDAHGWRYLALPGALLHFVDDTLFLSTRYYLVGADYAAMAERLAARAAAEDQALGAVKTSLRRMEEALLRRMGERP